RAHVQPARRARGDLGDRAPGLHRAHPAHRAGRRAELLRVARTAGLPDAGTGRGRQGRMSAPLLVELFTEELPPKALKALGAAFAERVVAGLVKRELAEGGKPFRWFATPRRLAVLVPD